MWIAPKAIAELAGVTYRPVASAVAAALQEGKAWRGARLIVRKSERRGRGGSAGLQLEVRVDSLPRELQRRYAERQAIEDPEIQPPKPWTQAERELRHEEFSRLTAKLQVRAQRAADAVRAFHASAGSQLSMEDRYKEAAAAVGASAASVRAWVKRCHQLPEGDWAVALSYKVKSAAPRAAISPGAWEFIEQEYLQLSKPALKTIHKRAARLKAEHGWALPSYPTVKRLVDKKIPRPIRVLRREGTEAFERLYSGAPRDYATLKLHEVWCADGHKVDMWVRMDDGSVIRPVIIPWQDCRTRLFVGYSIERVESAEAIMRSFRAAVENVRAVPEFAYLDNGRGFTSKQFTGGAETRHRFKISDDEPPGVLTLLGVKLLWARPYNAKAKPIESAHRVFTEMAKRFPGAYCGNSADAKPEDVDPAKAVPIAEFRKAVAEAVNEHNSAAHRGDAMHGRSPQQVYKDLLPQTAVRQPTKAQLRLCLMARKTVKLSRADRSITVLGNRYWSRDLASLDESRPYVAAYDPEDATVPLALYSRDGARFLLDVPLQAKTGFRNAEAAKEGAAALRQAKRAARDLEAARKAAREAGLWPAPIAGSRTEGTPASAQQASAAAKVVRADFDSRFKRRGAASARISLAEALAVEFGKNKASG